MVIVRLPVVIPAAQVTNERGMCGGKASWVVACILAVAKLFDTDIKLYMANWSKLCP